MKRNSRAKSKSPEGPYQKWLSTSRTGRLATFILVAIALAALALTSISFAQVNKRIVRGESSEQKRSTVSVPKRTAPTQPTSSKSKRGSTNRTQREGFLGGPEGPRDRMRPDARPQESRLSRARTFNGDLRLLPQTRPLKVERPERESPEPEPRIVPGLDGAPPPDDEGQAPGPSAPVGGPSLAAPAPTANFEGLDFNNWGAGHPPDTVGDVGPNHYIQSINSSVGIYDKATGTRITAFTFNTLMSQGNFGNLCDTNNFGDPVILYDTFEDRWVLTDFAFQQSGGGVVSPPGAFQCFAVSKTGDPVLGGWNYYSLQITDLLNDYPKFGIWTDGIYMSSNMYGFPAGGTFQNPRVWAFNKAQMYAGAPSVQSVSFNAPPADFTILPSNARLQTGTPPPGTPNYFVSSWEFLNALTVYKFHVDWDHTSLSTFTGPDIPIAASSWPSAAVPNAPSLGGNSLDVLQIRAMMQNQYSNIGGVESLWASHTVRRQDATGFAAPRFYQLAVTGGTVAANIAQAATFDPDGANVIHRFMPSLAVDRAGNMAIGYSTSSSTTKPAIKYAGRLSTDPINTFSQSEQVLMQGAGTQTGTCGGAPCTRWGDYSAMSLDPNGCTFWYTNMYYASDGLDHHTRIGSFALPQCVTIGSGSVQGTVTSSSGGGPVGGATVALGSRTTTTDPSGVYSFTNIPAGTYPSISASFPGYTSSTVNNLVVNEAAITTQDFVLSPGSNADCLTDTSQLDFQRGIATSVDFNTSPGSLILADIPTINQQNLSVTNSGFGFNATNWIAQTFTPTVTGTMTRADIDLFCSGCTGTTPNLTMSLRATAGDLPTGPDLATATIPGFNSGSGGYFAANFGAPPTLIAGTRYALVVRPVSNPSAGIYAYVVSTGSPYLNGRRSTSANSGGAWTGVATDMGFKVFMKTGYPSSGNLVSGLRDANPHLGGTVTWTTLSFNASTPPGTSVKFQVAASNSATGPFNFVGPDTTAATFFTVSGSSLAQFNGKRYIKYKAILETTSSVATPIVSDVTLCYSNTVPTTLTVNSAIATYGGTVNLSAKLTDGVSPVSGKTVDFTLNGNSVGSAVTDGSGVASLLNASLAGINANTYPSGVAASFAGDATFLLSSATNSLTVNKANAVIVVNSYIAPYDGNPHTATGTATGVNSESLSGLDLSGTTHTNAANYPGDPWTFTDVTGNYNNANGTVDDAIGKVNASITINGYSGVYDGGAHGASGSATGAQGENLSSLLNFGSTFTNVPGGTAHWTFNAGNANGNYNFAEGDVAITITKATPAFSNLSSPTIECHAPTTTLSGKITYGLLIPTGSVNITVNSVTQNALVQPDGTFSSTFNTSALTPADSPKAITYNYLGDGNFNPINGGGVLTIVDTGLPTINLNGNVITLWSPNNKFTTVNVSDLVASVSDGCTGTINVSNVVISKVTSDEGTIGGGDIVIAANCKSVQLRADRNGTGDGRVYTITFKVNDLSGNSTTTSTTVTVPHDQSGPPAVNSGIAYTVNGTCP